MTLDILIVEDDPMMRLGLTHSLTTKPTVNVIGEAEDGYQGVVMAQESQPDLILMEQVMNCLTHQPTAPVPDHPLSSRELEVLELIVEGY